MSASVAVGGGRTLFDKIWDSHRVASLDGPDILAIDLHLVHEASSLQAWERLTERGNRVRHPHRTLGVVDHVVPVRLDAPAWRPQAKEWADALERSCAENDVPCLPYGHRRQGIVHVVGPELGASRPGSTIVCGDSHTTTHGALGALAFGIGTTQVAHVLATQALIAQRPATMEIRLEGQLRDGVTSKDVALALIEKYGNLAGAGSALEFRGPVVERLSIESRMTLCNMGIEFGSKMALVAPDATTVDYVMNSQFPPEGDRSRWQQHWLALRTDPDARFDRSLSLDVSQVAPFVTWGTNPSQAVSVAGVVPDPDDAADAAQAESMRRALDYMDLRPGTPMADVRIDVAFIGSCTNARIEDLRAAADVLRGQHVATGVDAFVVPGSMSVKAQAEAEGLDAIFTAAGFRWSGAGCAFCIAANGELVAPGARSASTTNRNFEGRQGTGARTHLMSPASVAASAVAGRLVGPGAIR